MSISAHGCKYESKHDVLTNSWVMLELKSEAPDQPAVAARGLVKWVQRSVDTGGAFQTAIELEDPGNIWGLATPPADWVPYCDHGDNGTSTAKPKPFALRKPEVPAVIEEKRISAPAIHETRAMVSQESIDRPLGQLMGNFQRQIEQTLFDAASVAVQERVKTAVDEARASLKEEARRFVAEAASAQSDESLREFANQLKQTSAEGARTLHAEWTRTIDADLKSAILQIEGKNQALQEQAETLASSAIEKVQRGLETSRRDAVSRIVERLKEQSAPVVEEAKKATSELQKAKEGLEAMIEQLAPKSGERLEEVCVRLESQFETVVQHRLDAARTELDRAAQSATNLALSNMEVISQHQEAETKARFSSALEPVTASAIADLKVKAAATSNHFANELASYSRSHLEFVANSIAEFAKGLGKPPAS